MAWHHEKEKDKAIDKGNTPSADIRLLVKLRPHSQDPLHLLRGRRSSSRSLSLSRNSSGLRSSNTRGSSRGSSRRSSNTLSLTSLTLLQIRQTTSLSMNIADLLIGLNIKVTQLLTGGVLQSLLEVRAQAAPASSRLSGDLVAIIDTASALGGIVLLIEV